MVKGWHPGERIMHTKLGHNDDEEVMTIYQRIKDGFVGEMAHVYTNIIPFFPVVTLDVDGRPWSSILIGEKAEIGFTQVLGPNSLQFKAKLWPGDPTLENLDKASARDDKILIAGVGVDYLKTRRRLKFAGHVENYRRDGYLLDLMLNVNQLAW
jgi:hypothetical protein